MNCFWIVSSNIRTYCQSYYNLMLSPWFLMLVTSKFQFCRNHEFFCRSFEFFCWDLLFLSFLNGQIKKPVLQAHWLSQLFAIFSITMVYFSTHLNQPVLFQFEAALGWMCSSLVCRQGIIWLEFMSSHDCERCYDFRAVVL